MVAVILESSKDIINYCLNLDALYNIKIYVYKDKKGILWAYCNSLMDECNINADRISMQ